MQLQLEACTGSGAYLDGGAQGNANGQVHLVLRTAEHSQSTLSSPMQCGPASPCQAGARMVVNCSWPSNMQGAHLDGHETCCDVLTRIPSNGQHNEPKEALIEP